MHMVIILAQGRLRQEDCHSKVNLSNTLSQKKKRTKEKEGRRERTINIYSSDL